MYTYFVIGMLVVLWWPRDSIDARLVAARDADTRAMSDDAISKALSKCEGMRPVYTREKGTQGMVTTRLRCVPYIAKIE